MDRMTLISLEILVQLGVVLVEGTTGLVVILAAVIEGGCFNRILGWESDKASGFGRIILGMDVGSIHFTFHLCQNIIELVSRFHLFLPVWVLRFTTPRRLLQVTICLLTFSSLGLSLDLVIIYLLVLLARVGPDYSLDSLTQVLGLLVSLEHIYVC